MFIEEIFPDAVGEKTALKTRLIAQAEAREIPEADINALLSLLPPTLGREHAFLDQVTGLWRYEFGFPHQVGQNLYWGTHMWEQVDRLLEALLCVHLRMPPPKQATYLRLLDNPRTHQQTLVEVIPASKIAANVPSDYEISGLGNGNRTVDWVIGPHEGRTVLCDVKRRTKDILIHFGELDQAAAAAPDPNHDSAILFRSVEQKFVSRDPNQSLQGAWIVTDLQQNQTRLLDAFADLDPAKVHFAILGDWEADAHVLARLEQDETYLRSLFRITPSTRFVFGAS